MPGFIATLYNPVTEKTASSEVEDLDGAKIRAKTLRTLEPLADRPKCILKAHEPDGTVWELRKVLQNEFWRKSDDA